MRTEPLRPGARPTLPRLLQLPAPPRAEVAGDPVTLASGLRQFADGGQAVAALAGYDMFAPTMPITTRIVPTDHGELAVHLAGRGPLAVLLHGFPLDHRMWLDTLQGPLATVRTLAAIDLRGHGRSPWFGDAVHPMATFAADVAAVLGTLADGPVDVLGLSMGGYVAQALLADHPERVRSLGLVNTRARGDDAAAMAGRAAAMAKVVEQGRAALAAGMLPKLLADAGGATRQLLVARLQTMVESLPVETILADLAGLRDRPDRSEWLTTVRVPTLVVAGALDAIVPRAEAEAMAAAVPGARLAVLPQVGHLAPMEDPVGFAAVVGSFWAALSG